MEFEINKAIEILERSPSVYKNILSGLSAEWVNARETENSWSAFDIMGHLIHGELTDWIPRTMIFLSNEEDKTFEPFDMEAHFENSKGKTINDLIKEFKDLRNENITILKTLEISPTDLERTAIHPALGKVKLKEHLATWVVHDLTHIAQINRILAKQYKSEVGLWIQWMPIMER